MNKLHKYHILLGLLMAAWLLHFISPIYYTAEGNEIKQEQQHLISSGKAPEHYTVFRLPVSRFNVFVDREGKELKVAGKLYDIVSLLREGDQIICTVLEDLRETSLVKRIEEYHRHDSPAKTHKQQ